MERYIRFVAKQRRILLILFILVNIFSIIGITRIKIDSAIEIFMPDESSFMQVNEEMEAYFPGVENIMFIVNTGTDTLDIPLIERLHSFQQYLDSHNQIQYVNGPTPDIMMNGRHLIRLNRLKEEDLTEISSYYENLGELSPMTFHNNSLYGVFEAFPEDSFTNEHIHEIEAELSHLGFEYAISGEKYMQLKIFDYILKILLMIPPIALLLILLVFRSQMRSAKATLFSVLPAGIGALWTMGLIGWSGNEISIITVLAPIFTIVIGSADGLHFVSHVQDELEKKTPRKEALIHTLRMVGIPMIITTITSIVGFLVLLVMNNASIRGLALSASLGILLAGIATWFVLPLILTGSVELGSHRTKKQIARSKQQPRIQRFWGWRSLLLVLVLIVIAAIGIPRLTTEFSMLSIYKEYTEVKRGFNLANEVNNGSIPLFLFIEHGENPLEPTQAEDISELTSSLESSGQVGKIISPYTFISMINESLNTDANGYPSSMKIAQSLYNITSRRAQNPLEYLIDTEANKSRIILFPKDLDNATIAAIMDISKNFEAKHPEIKVSPTGAQFLIRELNQSMVKGQTTSILLAFFIIYMLLLMTLRDPKVSLLALLPIAIAVITIYGSMGILGLSLNLITITIFGITMGVGIDYAIHFTFVWKSFKKEGFSSEESASKAITFTARPIMTNGFGIAIGLSALFVSPLLIHLYIAQMMWVSMVVSMLLSLTFLPTILKKVK